MLLASAIGLSGTASICRNSAPTSGVSQVFVVAMPVQTARLAGPALTSLRRGASAPTVLVSWAVYAWM
jgi:hypothetical protein